MENLADVQVSIAVQSALAMGEVVQAGGRLFSFALPPDAECISAEPETFLRLKKKLSNDRANLLG